MFIKCLDDTIKCKERLQRETPSIIVYCFYKNTLSDALYVGKTEQKGNRKFNYLMNHRRIPNIRTKFKEGIYLHIWFPQDMGYINPLYFEPFMIRMMSPPMNSHGRHYATQVQDDILYEDHTDKYEKISPYTDYQEVKPISFLWRDYAKPWKPDCPKRPDWLVAFAKGNLYIIW